MFLSRVLLRFIGSVLIVFALPFWASAAHGQDIVDQCIAASGSGQKLRDKGDLIGAEQRFVQCASNSCPAVIRHDCQEWVSELGPSIPSIVIQVKGESGRGRVLLDGRQVRVTPSPIRLNPGKHDIAWELPGRETSSQEVTIGVGSRAKVVTLVPGREVETIPDVPGSTQRGSALSRIPMASWILGGVGVVGVGGFAVLGIASTVEYDKLAAGSAAGGCAPTCTEQDVEPVRTLSLAADISLGVGVASLAAATILAFAIPDEPEGPQSARRPRLDVAVDDRGVKFGLSGTF